MFSSTLIVVRVLFFYFLLKSILRYTLIFLRYAYKVINICDWSMWNCTVIYLNFNRRLCKIVYYFYKVKIITCSCYGIDNYFITFYSVRVFKFVDQYYSGCRTKWTKVLLAIMYLYYLSRWFFYSFFLGTNYNRLKFGARECAWHETHVHEV